MKTPLAVGLLLTALWASPVQAMTVQDFLTQANRIPRNPTALLRSDTRRLMNEINAAFKAVGDEQKAAQAAGRRPATCVPEGEKVRVSPDLLLAKFNAIPPARRNMSVKQAVQEWMAADYPCPA